MKLKTMNSVYELNDEGLFRNGKLEVPIEQIEVVGYVKDAQYYYLERDILPKLKVDRMLYVGYDKGKFVRTSRITEIIEQ
jgi:hypothetical protein